MKVFVAISLFFFMSELTFSQTSTAKKDSHEAPFILGVVDQIQSRELAETRILNIYLPEGYNKNDTVHYPVVYLLDGSAEEDFIHIAGLYQFNSFSWINRVPKSIIVGPMLTEGGILHFPHL